LRNEYLGAENRILRGQIKGRLLLSEGEKATEFIPTEEGDRTSNMLGQLASASSTALSQCSPGLISS
jgi:hypothetical protein